MESLLGLGVLALVFSATVVGLRLLGLARRTRELPELALGVSFLTFGAVGYPLSIAARRGVALGFLDSGDLLAAAWTSQDIASLAVALATWKTFRAHHAGLRWFVVGLAAAYVASQVGHALTVGFAGARDGGGWYYVGFTARAIPFIWAAAEAARYARLQRRRLRLGLADPVVADRFRLWAISSGTIAVGFGIFLGGRLLVQDVVSSTPVLLLTSAVGLLSGITMWMAFVPPAWYLRRVVAVSAR